MTFHTSINGANKENLKDYLSEIEKKTLEAFELANKARAQHKDPEDHVDIAFTKDLAAKTESLICIDQFPQLMNKGIKERIRELEKKYSKNDERVAFEIAKETALGKFYKFEDTAEAAEAGIRIGLAYLTGGIVTAPLEGIAEIKIKKNHDNSDYLAVYYAGPIRSAGGTASALSVLLSDYIRSSLGVAKYQPTKNEIERYVTEVEDYFTRVTKKQYTPTRKETRFIASNLPVEITGTPTEDKEVSNYKDLERVETNKIRGGMCLIMLDGLPLKANKLISKIQKFHKDFPFENWKWLQEFVHLKESLRDSKKERGYKKYTPNKGFLDNVVAGRPVLSHHGAIGGFRLRYGRSRTAGLAALSFHPATMEIADRFIAIGTQLRTEYPGKATVATPCDSIEPPVVKLHSGDVVRVESRDMAKKLYGKVDEILFMGDILIPYGEFLENGRPLLPSGYVEEWWAQEVRHHSAKAKDYRETYQEYTTRPYKIPPPDIAFEISNTFKVPLHPYYTYWWHHLTKKEFLRLYEVLKPLLEEKAPLNNKTDSGSKIKLPPESKPLLEKLLIPHTFAEDGLTVENETWYVLSRLLKIDKKYMEDFRKDPLETIQKASGITLRNKAPIFLGIRMGRPEKADKRLMKGSPQVLFPCGRSTGGRYRNLMLCYSKNNLEESFVINYCESCNKTSPFSYCPYCGGKTQPLRACTICKKVTKQMKHCGKKTVRYNQRKVDIAELMDIALKNCGIKNSTIPELLKSPRGVTSMDKHVEPLEKGLLRQKYNLYVNKDGTVRYDCTDLILTAFKPKEINTSIEKLKELGYTRDISGNELKDENQLLILKPQDVIIPDHAFGTSATNYLMNVANFVDELLVKFYNMRPYYNLKSKEDLIGQLVIGLAPHTSGGVVGRIIGFTRAKGCFAHPFWHAAKRRNCLPGSTRIVLENSGTLNTCSLEELYKSSDQCKIVDEIFTTAKTPINKYAISFNPEGVQKKKKINKVYRTFAQDHKISIKTSSGREIEAFPEHIIDTSHGKKRFFELRKGDKLLIPEKISITSRDFELDLLKLLDGKNLILKEQLVVRNISRYLHRLIKEIAYQKKASRVLGMNKKTFSNYIYRDSVPLHILLKLLRFSNRNLSEIPHDVKLAVKRDTLEVDRIIKTDEHFFRLLGYYLAEGHLRFSDEKGKEFYQVCFTTGEKEIRDRIMFTIKRVFGLDPHERGHTLTISSRIVYELFKQLDLGKNARSKRLQDMFKRLPLPKLKALLSAFFDVEGIIGKNRAHIICFSMSKALINDISFCLSRFGIFHRIKTERKTVEENLPSKCPETYKGNVFAVKYYALSIHSDYAVKFGRRIGFGSIRKQKALENVYDRARSSRIEKLGDLILDPIEDISFSKNNEEFMYDIEVEGLHNFLTENCILSLNCDGDEDSIMLLMDALLNFSRKFLPDKRGTRSMDSCMVLSAILHPDEVDSESWNVDVMSEYPLEFYDATLQFKDPKEVKMRTAKDLMDAGGSEYYFKHTHDTTYIEDAPLQTSYITLGEMAEKVKAQLSLGKKIRAVKEHEVAELLLEKHFIRDIAGNLRAFSRQQFRCVDCNEKFRRIPLKGVCSKCSGKLLLTVSSGTVKKYLQPSEDIADNFEISPYLRQQIVLLKKRIQSIFGKEEKQFSLGKFV